MGAVLIGLASQPARLASTACVSASTRAFLIGFSVLRDPFLNRATLVAAHVQQLETQCTSTSMVETLCTVAFGEPQQLLNLTQAAPRKLTLEQLLRKASCVFSEFLSLLA